MSKRLIVFVFIFGLFSSCSKYESVLNDEISIFSIEGDQYTDYGENPFMKVADVPTSSFSVDADGASYSNCKKMIQNSTMPIPEAVRIEEFINYFNYKYDEPEEGQAFSYESELSVCPWDKSHHLLRFGLKGKDIFWDDLPGSNIVLLVDVSGSMLSDDKLPLLKKSFKELVNKLGVRDRFSIVTYAGASEVLLSPVSGDQTSKILEVIDSMEAGGGTAGAEGINTAYALAEDNYIEGGNNRIILATDGDFNVGISSQDELVNMIKEKRDSGIFLSVLGVGRGNLNDSMMEQLADHGNGNFEYVGDEADAVKVLNREFKKFYTVAQDVKIQITFDSESVALYRLIGYENRLLTDDNFDNDNEDAGEIGCNQSITAIYELILNENAGTKICSTDIRYKYPLETESQLLNYEVMNESVSFGDATSNHRFAASVAAFGMKLKNSKYDNGLSYDDILNWTPLQHENYDPYLYKKDFVELVGLAKQLSE